MYKSFIYFIKLKNEDGFIKIGYSKDPKHRFGNIRKGLPYEMELVGFYLASQDEERELHKKFEKHRVKARYNAEWYHPCDELLDFIKNL